MRQYIKIGAADLPNIPKRDVYKFQIDLAPVSGEGELNITGWTFITTLKRGVLPDDPEDEDCAVRRFDDAPAGALSEAGIMIITLTGGEDGDTDIAPAEYVITVRRVVGTSEPWVVLQQAIRVLATGAQNFIE